MRFVKHLERVLPGHEKRPKWQQLKEFLVVEKEVDYKTALKMGWNDITPAWMPRLLLWEVANG